MDLTQKELALRVGCSKVTITKIEANDRRPSRQIAALLADQLEVPAAERADFLRAARGELHPKAAKPPAKSAAAQETIPSPATMTRQIPFPITPLVGREHEFAEIGRLLLDPQCRLLTLTGLGGIGKTHLALQVANDIGVGSRCSFPDGIFFVPLAPVHSPASIVAAIAKAISLAHYGAGDSTQKLLDYLHDKSLLLLLDNMEHLLEVSSLLSAIVEQAPRVKLLVTSSERLNLRGEWVFELQGLPVPPPGQTAGVEEYSAVKLFLSSARRARADFVIMDEDQEAVVNICRLLEGIPLGIELAAAWVPLLSCQEIAQEVARNLDFLSAHARDVPPRHRSLRAAFDHSWRLLTPAQRRSLSQLSVFQGGFDRRAAIQVAGADLSQISSLADKSLLHRLETGRFEMHELVRQYAGEHLREDPLKCKQAHHAHSVYYADLAKQLGERIKGPDQPEAVAELSVEIDNLRQAWAWMVEQRQTEGCDRAQELLEELKAHLSPDRLDALPAQDQALAFRGLLEELLLTCNPDATGRVANR